jgi:hypothetical protein
VLRELRPLAGVQRDERHGAGAGRLEQSAGPVRAGQQHVERLLLGARRKRPQPVEQYGRDVVLGIGGERLDRGGLQRLGLLRVERRDERLAGDDQRHAGEQPGGRTAGGDVSRGVADVPPRLVDQPLEQRPGRGRQEFGRRQAVAMAAEAGAEAGHESGLDGRGRPRGQRHERPLDIGRVAPRADDQHELLEQFEPRRARGERGVAEQFVE